LLGHSPPRVTTRVLVVGAGVIGLWVARCCLARGFEVTILDREPQSRQSCSFRNAGLIVPSHFVPLAAPGAVIQGMKWMLDATAPFHIRPRLSAELAGWLLRFAGSANAGHVARSAPLLRDLCLAGREAYAALAATPAADIGFAAEGLIVACATRHAFDDEVRTAESARRLGLAADAHAGRDALAIEPALRADIAGLIHYPLDAQVAPHRLMARLESDVVAAGGRLCWESGVVAWRTRADRIAAAVDATGNVHEADEFVLCAGAWSREAVRSLGLRLPLQAGKGYSLTLSPRAGGPSKCAILAEARASVTPMPDGLRVGGTMELDGLDRRIDAARVRAIAEAAGRYYPGLAPTAFEGVEPWSGLRPLSPDGLPYIGRTARHRNLLLATGHAMMVVTLAPVTGRIVADLVAGELPPFDLAPLSPDRFR